MNEFRTFYEGLAQPGFAPPPEVFGVAWSIIYPLIIIAGIYILTQAIRRKLPVWLFGVYVLNFFFNLLFTPLELEFGLLVGTVDILLVLVTLIWLELGLWKRSALSFTLLLPYLLWVSFAVVLQLALLFLNIGAV